MRIMSTIVSLFLIVLIVINLSHLVFNPSDISMNEEFVINGGAEYKGFYYVFNEMQKFNGFSDTVKLISNVKNLVAEAVASWAQANVLTSIIDFVKVVAFGVRLVFTFLLDVLETVFFFAGVLFQMVF